MYTGTFEGVVMNVYEREQGGKKVAMFDLYQKGSKEVMQVKGNGVKEGQQFKGSVGVSFIQGKTKDGKEYAFVAFEKVEQPKV